MTVWRGGPRGRGTGRVGVGLALGLSMRPGEEAKEDHLRDGGGVARQPGDVLRVEGR